MKARKPKKITAQCWAILSRDGNLSAASVRTSNRTCIRDYMAQPGNKGAAWAQLKRWGWACIPVTLSFTTPSK
jgi:hypothetical protein